MSCITSKPFLRCYKRIAVTLSTIVLILVATGSRYGTELTKPNSSEFGISERSQVASICRCNRNLEFERAQSLNPVKYISTCSDEATFNSTGQNVVSMCLHIINNNTLLTQYIQGIHLNLVAMRKYYPGFTMRVYSDYTFKGPQDPICQALCKNPDLFWCDIRKTPLLGNQSTNLYFMEWRFLPLGDPTVDVFLSRDLDSVITSRENAAVKDWLQLKEKKGIQIMRDHIWHTADIMGGMWGAKNSWLANVTQLQKQIVKVGTALPKKKGVDQQLLALVVYSKRQADIVAYDSYFCITMFRETMHRPFSVRRKMVKGNLTMDFVGNKGLGTDIWTLFKCPKECRPNYGKDWEYC